jgi:hypothetical protein
MKLNDRNQIKYNPRLWLIFLILLPWVLNSIRQPDSDFELFTTTAREWMSGETRLYDVSHVRFTYLPWSLVVSLPFSYIPHPYGLLVFNTLSLGLLIWSTWSLVKPVRWWVLAISLTTFYTAIHMMLGQWDILVLAALTLGWLGVQRRNPWLVGLALVGMTTKYTNIILPMLLLLYAIRHWPFKDLVRVATIPVSILLLSFFIVGWDWPLRYTRLMRVTLALNDHYELITLFSKSGYQTSYWRYLPPLGSVVVVCLTVIALYLIIRLARREVELKVMSLALTLNLVVTPYLMPYHNVYLAPVQAQLLKEHRALGFALFGASIVDLILMWFGIGLITYPLIALVMLIAISINQLHNPTAGGLKPALEINE